MRTIWIGLTCLLIGLAAGHFGLLGKAMAWVDQRGAAPGSFTKEGDAGRATMAMTEQVTPQERRLSGSPLPSGPAVHVDTAAVQRADRGDRGHAVTVLRVVDGQTIVAELGDQPRSVRLLNLNVPQRGEVGHEKARQSLADLVGNSPQVVLDFPWPGKPFFDDDGTLAAYVFAGDRCVNIEMVRRGWSKYWAREDGRGKYPMQFQEAEHQARAARSGLWDISQ